MAGPAIPFSAYLTRPEPVKGGGPPEPVQPLPHDQAPRPIGADPLMDLSDAIMGALGITDPFPADASRATGLGAMVGAAMPVVAGIRAFHGTPHNFDQFKLSAIGTGEGAQSYGHGLYFAENEATAKTYRDALSKPNEGHMHEVNLDADPKALLDWDKPLTEQSPKVLDAFVPGLSKEVESYNTISDKIKGFGPVDTAHDRQRMGALVDAQFRQDLRIKAALPENLVSTNKTLSNMSGEDIYHHIARAQAEKSGYTSSFTQDAAAASAKLNAQGIPGIRYLDQGSRTAGEGTHNFVIFDDSIVSILRKYGLLLPLAAPAATQLARPSIMAPAAPTQR